MVKVRWLEREDWKTGHPFYGFNGYTFNPDEPVDIMDAETLRLIRQHPELFAIEEADDGQAQEGQEVKEGEDDERKSENKTGYVPVKKPKTAKPGKPKPGAVADVKPDQVKE
jgi:hypothetical protein